MEILQNQKIQEENSDISSPAQEFSFTIPPNSFSRANLLTVDLTPADDIFSHGQLLPLQLLSNLPVSARSSTNSLHGFTPPIRSVLDNDCDKARGHSFNSSKYDSTSNGEALSKGRAKSKSFSLLRVGRREEEGEGEKGKPKKKKLRFDVGHFLKRYLRMFSKERREDIQFRKKPYSFSGKPSSKEEGMNLRRRAEFSAPASMRTSPSNSGRILIQPLHHSNDSSMEELQAAIQAAIAHCKNSIAAAEKAMVVS